jgi:hypothetical protein
MASKASDVLVEIATMPIFVWIGWDLEEYVVYPMLKTLWAIPYGPLFVLGAVLVDALGWIKYFKFVISEIIG